MIQLFRLITSRAALTFALLPAFVAGCGGGLDPILGTPDIGVVPLTDSSRPTVVITTPAPGAAGVSTNTQIEPAPAPAPDEFAKELAGARYEVITVEGHTDRLGTSAYSEKLSARRAQTVKAYLVNSGGIDASKVAATGKGESTPMTNPEDCKGTAPTARLIACLQADRRVEVEVSGTH